MDLLLYGTVLFANNAKNSDLQYKITHNSKIQLPFGKYRASVETELMVEMLLALFFVCNVVYQVEQSKSGTVPVQ